MTIKEITSEKLLTKYGAAEQYIFLDTFDGGLEDFMDNTPNKITDIYKAHPLVYLQNIEELTNKIVNSDDYTVEFAQDLGFYYASLSNYLESIGESAFPIN